MLRTSFKNADHGMINDQSVMNDNILTLYKSNWISTKRAIKKNPKNVDPIGN